MIDKLSKEEIQKKLDKLEKIEKYRKDYNKKRNSEIRRVYNLFKEGLLIEK
jgi:hypothetical protein